MKGFVFAVAITALVFGFIGGIGVKSQDYADAYDRGYRDGFDAQWRPDGEKPNPEHEFPVGHCSDRGITLFDKDGLPYWHLYVSRYPEDDGHWYIQHRPAHENCGGTWQRQDEKWVWNYEGCGFHGHIETKFLENFSGQDLPVAEWSPPKGPPKDPPSRIGDDREFARRIAEAGLTDNFTPENK